MIKFVYKGEAVGKGRPRVSRAGGYVHTYTPKKTRDFEDAIRYAFKAENKEPTPVYARETSLYAEVVIGVAVPKSYSKKMTSDCLLGDICPTKKPDIDNILKSVLDALNGLAYEDDAQVIQIYALKKYANEPYIDITIGERGEL